MGLVRKIAIVVLTISFFTFVAFFGRLPALRNTPIGALHRAIWIHIPAGFRRLDQYLTNGRLSSWVMRLAHTLWNDRHPVVVIFFILVLSISEALFITAALPMMDTALRIKATIAIILPYVFLYLSASTDPGYITPENHYQAMTLYPYDFTIFHPGHTCTTCNHLKPARSKHCGICKRCISKLDHHCIFINNCVGYRNQHYFLLLLFFTGALTAYCTFTGTSILSSQILVHIPTWTIRGKGISWSNYAQIWIWALQDHAPIGAVTLLCLLTTPLIWGLLSYHVYLVWAGTTTNETMKWSDWKDEMTDGFAFKKALPADRQRDERIEPAWSSWPCDSQQMLLRTEDGTPPEIPNDVGTWERVWGLKDVENLYDLGFWDNLTDVFCSRNWLKWGAQPTRGSEATNGRSG